MMKRRKKILKKKKINLDLEELNLKALDVGMWKFIKEHPTLSTAYKYEFIARDKEKSIQCDTLNQRRKRFPTYPS